MAADGTFTLTNASYAMGASSVGGSWTGSGTKVYVDATSASLPAGVLEELLPDGEPVTVSGGKWKFAKAAKVGIDKKTGEVVADTSKGSNVSGLKLTYTPKTGFFKGSFNAYALDTVGGKKKLKKYTVNVSGVVVDGVGHGQATCKKPASGPWPVAVR